MKELSGSAAATVESEPESCFELVAAIDRYPSWFPETVRHVDVLERDAEGRPARARMTVHVAVGPLVRDFDLPMEVSYQDRQQVRLSRIPHEPSDPERFEVVWHLGDEQPPRLGLELGATLDVPRLVPVGGIGDRLAQDFVDAAKRQLERPSPASASTPQ